MTDATGDPFTEEALAVAWDRFQYFKNEADAISWWHFFKKCDAYARADGALETYLAIAKLAADYIDPEPA